MKYCNEDVGKWSLPCGYPRQWLDGGGCLVDDEAPVGTPCRIGPDGLPVRDHDGHIVVDELSGSWFYGWALSDSDELSNPHGPYDSEADALTAGGHGGRWPQFDDDPHFVCGQVHRDRDGRLRLRSRLIRGF